MKRKIKFYKKIDVKNAKLQFALYSILNADINKSL